MPIDDTTFTAKGVNTCVQRSMWMKAKGSAKDGRPCQILPSEPSRSLVAHNGGHQLVPVTTAPLLPA
jgi:hypothetical protein